VDNSAPVITTTRLILRGLQGSDAETIVEFFAEPEAQPYLLVQQRNADYMRTFVRFFAEQACETPWSTQSHFAWAIALRETLEVIGMCSLSHATAGSHWGRLGWHLSGRFSGKGYATEAGRELVRFALEERRVARVVAECFESNVASRRVFAKLGMLPLPALALRKWWLAFTYREWKPIVRYVITKQSFRDNALAA